MDNLYCWIQSWVLYLIVYSIFTEQVVVHFPFNNIAAHLWMDTVGAFGINLATLLLQNDVFNLQTIEPSFSLFHCLWYVIDFFNLFKHSKLVREICEELKGGLHWQPELKFLVLIVWSHIQTAFWSDVIVIFLIYFFWTTTSSVRLHQISCGQTSSITCHNLNWVVAMLLIEISIFVTSR